MVRKIKNPFSQYREKDKFPELMDLVGKHIQEISADIHGNLNGDNLMDYLDDTYEIFDEIWNYLMIQAFVGQDEIEVVSLADLSSVMEEDYEMESCGISSESGERYVLFRMLPIEMREQLAAKTKPPLPTPPPSVDTLTDSKAWLD